MRDLLRVLALIAALGIVGIGAMLGLVGIAISLMSGGPDMLMLVTSSASILLLSVGLGLAAAWHAWRAIQGSPSAAFRPQRVRILVTLFLLALVLGQTMLSLSLLPALTFPLFHIGATILPILIVLALVGRSLGGAATWRELVLQAASGAFVATPIAFILEGLTILLIGISALLSLAWQPGGQDLIQRATSYLQDPSLLQDPGLLAPALLTPGILVIAFAVVAGLIPLIEEAVKTIGVPLMGYRRPSLPQAALWGLAAGAGFAAAEGLLNASSSVGASWLPVVSLRVGTTLLHCLTGMVMGLAWYQIVSRQRWFHGLLLYAASVAVHGLWNALALSLALASFRTVVGPGAVASLVLLVLLGLGLAVGLASMTAYARQQSPFVDLVRKDTVPAPLDTLATEDAGDED
jgi:RsiW-degrading membrane proteinase PrsW (M82 family)